MLVKIVASTTAVLGAAALTLACPLALALSTIHAVSIQQIHSARLPCADFVIGTFRLLGCIYLATHLAVRILGVGRAEFPPPPNQELPSNAPKTNV